MAQKITMSQAISDLSWLGNVVDIHSVGEYDIVEYWSHPASNDKSGLDRLNFATYIDGKNTHNSYPSLDDALVGAITRKHGGANCHAGTYFMRGIGADLPEVTRKSQVPA